jgi:hypothetical protein
MGNQLALTEGKPKKRKPQQVRLGGNGVELVSFYELEINLLYESVCEQKGDVASRSFTLPLPYQPQMENPRSFQPRIVRRAHVVAKP